MARRRRESCCEGKVCATCFDSHPGLVDMTHHIFLCQRCAKSEEHRRCHVKQANAAFTPNETRIVTYMVTHYTPPVAAKVEPEAPGPRRARVSLPSVVGAHGGEGVAPSLSVLAAPPAERRATEISPASFGPPGGVARGGDARAPAAADAEGLD
jgi:hypothetical protein